jgi:cytochrome c-type biogenesis protein CcmE
MSLAIKVGIVVLGLVFYFFSISSLLSGRSTFLLIKELRQNNKFFSTPSIGMAMEFSPHNKLMVSGLVYRVTGLSSSLGSIVLVPVSLSINLKLMLAET